MSFLSESKDRLVESLALPILNGSLFKPYGKATALHLNTTRKSAHLELELRGENEPLHIEVTQYELFNNGDQLFAVVKGLHTSREWLTVLAQEVILDEPIELPRQLGQLLSRLL